MLPLLAGSALLLALFSTQWLHRPIAPLPPSATPEATHTALPPVIDYVADVPAPSSSTSGTTAYVFDRNAAGVALASIDVVSCSQPDGPKGVGHMSLTFASTGRVVSLVVDPPFAGTSVGACVAARFRDVTIPPFVGPNVTVGKRFAH